MLRFRDWRHPLDQPHIWTPLFFLDDAVALAAGHRPCAVCRRPDYQAYRDAVSGDGPRLKATEMDRRLATERLRRGRGFSRAKDRPLWRAELDTLPVGTVVVDEARRPCLLGREARAAVHVRRLGGAPPAAVRGRSTCSPQPTSVVALRNGFTPTLHPSAVT